MSGAGAAFAAPRLQPRLYAGAVSGLMPAPGRSAIMKFTKGRLFFEKGEAHV
jgi:hypothetical protein